MQQVINSNSSCMQAAVQRLTSDSLGQIRIGHSCSSTNEKALNAHEHLYLEDNKQTHVYILLEGVVGTYKLLADGRRQIIGFSYPGDMLGLDQSGIYTNSAEALSACRFRCVPISAIDNLIQCEPGFGQTVLRATSQELAETRELLVSLGKKSAKEKLATFLLRISRRMDANGRDSSHIDLPMNRAEIGDYLGLTIETVSRNFTKLKRAQIIEIVSNSEVRILDMAALEAVSERLI